MITINNNQIFSTNNKYIHKIGTEIYFKRGTVLPNDTVDMFEEVDELPAYTKEEYDAMVAKLVRQRYSESEEFAIQRKAINAAFSPSAISVDSEVMENYQAYNAYVEECKQKAKNPELYKSNEEYAQG